MKFGQVDSADEVDFVLPEDPARNKEIIKGTTPFEVYVGCSKWGRPDWVGSVYPKGTKAGNYLNEYGLRFNSIELNATHYRVFPESTIQKWRDTVSDGFKFCPKFPQFISHIKRLNDADEMTSRFLQSVHQFGSKLGACFLQLPPNFTPKDLPVINTFLSTIPKDIEVFLEVRHKDWFQSNVLNELCDVLKTQNTGIVLSDTSGRRDCVHMHLTISAAFIRFVGNNLHPTDYLRIDDWVQRILEWKDQGIERVYFLMHHHEGIHAPDLCKYFAEQLNEKAAMNIPIPSFVN